MTLKPFISWGSKCQKDIYIYTASDPIINGNEIFAQKYTHRRRVTLIK